jgi:hypothetical protein
MTQVTSETGTGKERGGEVLYLIMMVAKSLKCQWKMNAVQTTGAMTLAERERERIICPTPYFLHHTTHMDWP